MSYEVNSDKFKCPSQRSGSALVLVLLITALLATIAVSFLSTSRVEQMAARNFSRQNAAAGLAELATQQAMAKIQLGFNATGNGTGNFTTVITTQPGAINKYFFSNGTLLTNRTITTDLFSTGSGNLSYLNNLENPSSSLNATTKQYTITGNRGERINVPMENVNATVSGNTTVIGRIAYYVDDEGSKLNANNAIGNRTTLNAALRPLDIGSLNATYSSNFTSVINQSTTTNSSSIVNWNYFFRSEQVGSAINSAGGNFSNNDLTLLTTAVTSANNTANMTHLLTPWGTQRIFINELPITSVGVNRIFSTLTGNNSTLTGNATTGSTANDVANGLALNNIFGGTFSQKYNDLGVKQIAANMLQMRSPNTYNINQSFSFNGTLLGADSLDGANYSVDAIPSEYLGFAPFPYISEISVSGEWVYVTTNGTGIPICPVFRPQLHLNIELCNPYNQSFNLSSAKIAVKWDSFRFDLTHRIISTNQTYTNTYGPKGLANGTIETWGISTNYLNNNTLVTPSATSGHARNLIYKTSTRFSEGSFSANNPFSFPSSSATSGSTSIIIPPKSKIQYSFRAPAYGTYGELSIGHPSGWTSQNGSLSFLYYGNNTSIPFSDIQFINLSNMTASISWVKLLANGNSASSIRDWVLGSEIGSFNIPINRTFTPFIATTQNSIIRNPPASLFTYQRINPLSITAMTAAPNTTNSTQIWSDTISANTNHTYSYTGNSTSTNATIGVATLNSTVAEQLIHSPALPSLSSSLPIPGDPSLRDEVANAVFAGSNSSDMREPYLVTGNYSCPADLGFVPTNQRWRRLRMQMQPKQEVSTTNGGNGSQTYIPDWSMMDAISFGNSTNATHYTALQHPVNINGRFNLPTNPVPTPRTIGIKALAKVLELSSNATIQDPINPASSNSTDATRFKGNIITSAATIAENISNMNWSLSSAWATQRSTRNFPSNQYILPSEIMEISGVADTFSQTNYTNSINHFKWNEGRASALIPAITTRSSFFMIYAHAQAGQLQDKNQPESASNPFVVDSEALTKTLVEVQYNSGNYTVKKLYTQPIPLGQ